MTRIEAGERTRKYNYLVGKPLGNDFIAAIMPVPIHPEINVEEIFTIVFNHLPQDQSLSSCDEFIVAVMLNYQEFMDHGTVIWKHLDDVLESLGINED
ncbi:hypothetical protein [Pedobacter sp. V48]|uniref:hypothetical protein n=1 Tax=Pedobacter sp. V48 TaxID=509635 RepID=UPI0003E56DA2|nr:hypothetical protein [Pedobacter sp. V48]ETZ23032.1 hypothetical protein N824_20565 [Pedobacter sp. V48]